MFKITWHKHKQWHLSFLSFRLSVSILQSWVWKSVYIFTCVCINKKCYIFTITNVYLYIQSEKNSLLFKTPIGININELRSYVNKCHTLRLNNYKIYLIDDQNKYSLKHTKMNTRMFEFIYNLLNIKYLAYLIAAVLM